MAWTDSCKFDAVAQIKKRAEKSNVRDALKVLSEESGIPIGTLRRWYWPKGNETYKEKNPNRQVAINSIIIDTPDIQELNGIRQDAETQLLKEAKEIRLTKKIEREKSNESIKKEIEPITGTYNVIVIDPPWPVTKINRVVRPNQVEQLDYPTMTVDEISATEIPFAKNTHIFLWTTHKFLPDALKILAGWGCVYVCSFVWHKNGGFQPYGLPQYNCEFALYGRKGTPSFRDLKNFFLCFNADRKKHSEKPDCFYETIRRVTHPPRLDMFNRRKIDGFDSWGYEAK